MRRCLRNFPSRDEAHAKIFRLESWSQKRSSVGVWRCPFAAGPGRLRIILPAFINAGKQHYYSMDFVNLKTMDEFSVAQSSAIRQNVASEIELVLFFLRCLAYSHRLFIAFVNLCGATPGLVLVHCFIKDLSDLCRRRSGIPLGLGSLDYVAKKQFYSSVV